MLLDGKAVGLGHRVSQCLVKALVYSRQPIVLFKQMNWRPYWDHPGKDFAV